MSFKFKVKLVSRIPEAARNIRRQAEEATLQAAQDVAVIARQRAPVKTGNLRDSITVYRNTQGNAEVGTDVEYAKAVEYGTSRQAAQPYLRPAMEAVKPQLIKKLKRMKVL